MSTSPKNQPGINRRYIPTQSRVQPLGLPTRRQDASDPTPPPPPPTNNPILIHVDENALYTDLKERVDYLVTFLNFTSTDVEALNDVSLHLEPLVPELVNHVYSHLFSFDVTKQVFMPSSSGKQGPMLGNLHDLTLDAPQILKRKQTFSVYIRKLLTADYNEFATWQYFDDVGRMHTGVPGLKHRKIAGKDGLFVDLMHLNLLLGWTQDALTPIVFNLPNFTLPQKINIIRALTKVFWIQQDLFARHYTVRSRDAYQFSQYRGQIGNKSSGEYGEDAEEKDRSDCPGAVGYFDPLESTFDPSTIATGEARLYHGGLAPVPTRTASDSKSVHGGFVNDGYGRGNVSVTVEGGKGKKKKGWFS